jgi:tetratricopeptide (TPR) repeat protein
MNDRAHRWLPAALAAVIVFAGVWAYATSFRGVFALDDVRAIVKNETIRSLRPLPGPLAPPGRSTVAGRPVANLSFAINYAVAAAATAPATGTPERQAPLDPAPFHAGNLVIHLLAACAVCGVARRTFLSPSLAPGFGRAAPWLAGAVALLWVVHPLTTAAVTYVVQRVESLMSLFYLLVVYCSIRVAEGRRAGWWTAAAVASCALGMATKEIMVTAPLVAAAWWWLFAGPFDEAKRRRAARLMAGLCATWVVFALLVAGERRGPSVDLRWSASWAYLLAQAEVVVHYLRLAVWPSPLVFLYDWPLGSSLAAVFWQAALLAGLVGLTAYGMVRRHPASVLGVSFFLVLAPSSSVVPIVTEVAAEHRMYLPLAAVISAIVCAAFVAGRRLIPSRTAGLAAGAVAVVVCSGLLAAGTRDRNRVYWSAESLWGDTVAKRPDDSRPRVAYGEALTDAGRLLEAQSQLEAAIALAPNDPAARVRLAVVLARQGRLSDALGHAGRALAMRPDDPDARRLVSQLQRAIEGGR